MINKLPSILAAIICCLAYSYIAVGEASNHDPQHLWPNWRGPLSTGVAPHADPPIEWSEDKSVRWKTKIPGFGHSTPIVWGDHLFLTATVPVGEAVGPIWDDAPGSHDNLPVTHAHRSMVLAVNRKSGEILWHTTVHEGLPHEQGHRTGSLASASPVTDGERVYAFFGSRGLYCLDFEGAILWEMDFEEMRSLHGHGEGASPALFGDTLIVNWDHEGQSYLYAIDKHSAEIKWKTPREEVTSWATPIVVEHGGKPQVVVSGTNRIRGYDLETGEVLWECGGMSDNVVASPVAGDGRVFAGSSYQKRAFVAINLEGASGDITGTDRVLWTRNRGTPYIPSPLLYDNALYFHHHYQNVLVRVNPGTGEEDWTYRLEGIRSVYASPLGAAGRVYITDLDGNTLVITHDGEPKVLGLNKLDDAFSASAAAVGKELFLRGEQYLYCLAEE